MQSDEGLERELSELAEHVGEVARATGRTVAVAESLTGGMLATLLARATDASEWFRGGIVAYQSSVKHDLLAVPPGPVVSRVAAEAMAANVARLLGATLGVAVTGVGGPEAQDGQPAGTVWLAVGTGGACHAVEHHFDGDPEQVCQATCRAALGAMVEQLGPAAPSGGSGTG